MGSIFGHARAGGGLVVTGGLPLTAWGSWLVAGLALLAAGCATPPAVVETNNLPPEGWTAVGSMSGDMIIALPPLLPASSTSGGIFAHEMVEPGEAGLQLMALGPRDAEPQPVAGDSIEQWLQARMASPVAGPAIVRRIELPAGPAVAIERIDSAGTRLAWRIAAYAIQTRFGVAVVVIDGPPDTWLGREADLVGIPWFVTVGPGRPPSQP